MNSVAVEVNGLTPLNFIVSKYGSITVCSLFVLLKYQKSKETHTPMDEKNMSMLSMSCT